ncbi:hypothetical protein ACP2AV_00080 [Aliiroseovarius sp. PTFE2010]|uniref:hypothetical protein n=1 Tax=Aliiroseovarius sp. PTFE2010 TaxID=3417190 RepID=UPI003CE7D05A
MKFRSLIPAAAMCVGLCIGLSASAASAASAACLVEYKAKRTNPTEYRHAAMTVPDAMCSPADARPYVQEELAKSGWTLLTIVKVSR